MYLSQGFSVEQRRDLHQRIFTRRPIGIISNPFDFTDEDVALAREMGIKHIIFLGFHTEPLEQTCSIVFPSQALGYLADQHLISHDHRHLAILHPDDAIQEEAFLPRVDGTPAAIYE